SETNEIAILNYLKYSIVKGGKPVEDVIRRDLGQIKSTSLIVSVYQHMKKYWVESDRFFDSNVKNIFEELLKKRKVAKENINDNDNDNDNDNEESYHDSYHDSSKSPSKPVYTIPYGEIVNFLNTKAGTKYHSSSKKTRKLIHSRWEEGFKLEDFKKVINIKIAEWKNSDMDKYLRPETLFGTKFESYLNQKPSKGKQRYNHFEGENDPSVYDALPF
ncbi:conserved phage C-terminal domain-containing protein, partial [Liquorilactobacillus satsumensis]